MKAVVFLVILFALALQASASSHSEAPGTAKKPSSDITDFYMWRSYADTSKLVLVMGVAGLQSPNAGPNYYVFSDQHFFEFHLSCDMAVGSSDHVFQFYFGSRFNGVGTGSYSNDYDYDCGIGQPQDQTRSVALSVGGQTVDIPLKVYDTISATSPDSVNFIESYNFRYYTNIGVDQVFSNPTTVNPAANSNFNTFRVPFSYVGDKTFGDTAAYEAYAQRFVYSTSNFLTCPSGPVGAKVFAGPRQEPFFIDLGRTFDLVNYTPIIDQGVKNCPENNDILRHNTNFIVLEVPICAITCPNVSPNVVGGWVGVRQLLHNSAGAHVEGSLTNRFGNALINELIIGIGDKQRWNYVHPALEANFVTYYKYPTFPAILESLFDVPAPNVPPATGRIDLYELLTKGVPGLNRGNTAGSTTITPIPADFMRINLDVTTDVNNYDGLGVIAGDNAGYPNGRRLFDDVVDITLRAVMGVLCGEGFEGGFGCTPDDAPVGNVPFGDGASLDLTDFPSTFPYLSPPNPGSVANPHPLRCAAGTSSVAFFAFFMAILAYFF